VKRPAAFIDRDGVLNRRLPGDVYVTCPDELDLLPWAVSGLRAIGERGYVLVVVTNQRGIARGHMSEADLTQVHAKLRVECEAGGAPLMAVYHCPHDRDTGCGCRKPDPGMLLRAADEHDLDLARSVLVGVSESDIEAGRRAGVPVRVLVESNVDWSAQLASLPPVAS
jgi:D-glycero-D-manno-heptose 1,7-bisphosphate phosphatase